MSNEFNRLKTGIYGLDRLLEGGFLYNSATGVMGSPGTGKSTFALQYALEGLEHGQNVLYLTFEEPPEKLLREAKLLGIGDALQRYYKAGNLIFHHASGAEMLEFLTEILPNQIETLKAEQDSHSRVILDPLTPLLWELEERKRQRNVLTKAFDLLREFGTVLITIEEPLAQPGTRNMETAIPLYLVDTIVNVQYLGLGGHYNRTLRILKSRGTNHGELVYPIRFIRGAGLVVFSEEEEAADEDISEDHDKLFNEYKVKISRGSNNAIKGDILQSLEVMKKNWPESSSPKYVLEELLEKVNRYKVR